MYLLKFIFFKNLEYSELFNSTFKKRCTSVKNVKQAILKEGQSYFHVINQGNSSPIKIK